MMKIHELYARDITRRINPAVVVSEMKADNIKQEIEEYIFTEDITRNIHKFLDAVANKKEGKTGVWISGYYGSGKSHFIKYLFYCLNKEYRDAAFDNFIEAVQNMPPLEEPSIGTVTRLQNKLSKLDIEEIIFNIDAVSNTNRGKDRITRVLLNQLNLHRGYNSTNIALALYLEKRLDSKGKFETFKEEVYNRFGDQWNESNIPNFIHSGLSNVIEVAHELDPQLDKDALRSAIMDTDKDYSIKFLINELEDYLKGKDEDFRLLFLMDEVSQYIGSDSTLLLNLQTIVEEIGSKIGTKVWVVCTAQQDLTNLISSADSKAEDFGKIMGRFETLISLQSQDAAYITKKRVLDKDSNGVGVLNKYYQENKGAIENQFYFNHDHYNNYSNRDDFSLTYPFVPYQFQLISDVFESFSNVGFVSDAVKNTERAILGITHFTADLCKDEEVGFFVPFDLFFNDQLDRNLTHRARGILNRAYTINEIREDNFATRVVRALFMISNLGESQSINFPANVENLAVLMMESAETGKQEMTNRVQKVLDVLIKENIIQVSEGKYRFFKEDEVEVAEGIKNTPITNEHRYTYINDDIITPLIRPERNITYGNNSFRMALKIDDKEIASSGDFETVFSFLENKDIASLAFNTNKQTLVVAINEWFFGNKDFRSKLDDYVRTQVYIRQNMQRASGPREQTLKNFRQINERLMSELKLRFEKSFLETPIISNQQVVTADELKGSTVKTRFSEMVNQHLEALYSRHGLSTGYATSNNALHASAASTQATLDKSLTPAEQELENYLILLGDGATVGDVVKKFEKPPFGWKDISTLDMFVQLAKKERRRFEWHSEEIEVKKFAEQALNSRERDTITVSKAKVYSAEETAKFIATVNDIFPEVLIPSSITDFKRAVDTFKDKLKGQIENLSNEMDDYAQYKFVVHIKTLHKQLEELYHIRNPEEVVSRTNSLKDKLKTSRDNYMQAAEFAGRNFDNYKKIIAFADNNKDNFSELDEADIPRSRDLIDYIKRNSEPWEEYPQMRKLYSELDKALRERLDTLRNSVIEKYKTVFKEIENRKSELNIKEPHITADEEYKLNQINKVKSIAQLKNLDFEAIGFRANNLKNIEDHIAKKKAEKEGEKFEQSLDISIAAEMTPTTITNEEELDAYLNKLREKLLDKLKNNKKLWLK